MKICVQRGWSISFTSTGGFWSTLNSFFADYSESEVIQDSLEAARRVAADHLENHPFDKVIIQEVEVVTKSQSSERAGGKPEQAK